MMNYYFFFSFYLLGAGYQGAGCQEAGSLEAGSLEAGRPLRPRK